MKGKEEAGGGTEESEGSGWGTEVSRGGTQKKPGGGAEVSLEGDRRVFQWLISLSLLKKHTHSAGCLFKS